MLKVRWRSADDGRPGPLRVLVAGVVLLAPLTLLSACSATPDWAKPTEWWDAVVGDDEDDTAKAVAADDKPYPWLGDTPARPQPETSSDQRREISKDLAADREQARYTDQTLRASGASTASPPPAAPAATRTTTASGAATGPAAAKPPAPEPTSTSTLATAAPRTSAPATGAAAAGADPGRPMSVPSIVQRRPGEVQESSRIEELTRPRGARASSTTASGNLGSAPARPAPVAAQPNPTTTAAAQPAPVAAPAPQAPVAAPMPQTPPALQPAVRQVASELPVGQDQSTLAQVFAANVVAQTSRSYPEAKGTVFQAPSAPPIAQWGAAIPPIVRDTYNAALNESAPAQLGNGTNGSNGVVQFAPGAPSAVVHFGHGSASLSGKACQQLRAFATAAKARGGFIRVVGHASQRTGDMPYSRHKAANFNMSMDRANAVARELRKQGVAPQRILVEARGDEDPIYFEFMPNGEAQNRRVEVFLQ